ncbi:MAG: hypothetical protein DWQ09_12050 [Proteobacteria bacterium]|nr:MAG: hypothetical protein DWQ09_12050 [Pseudomonadota bacterium]
MKKPISLRNFLSMAAASTVLSAALVASPVMAEGNDTYRTVHAGYLSEYQVQPGDLPTMTGSIFNAESGDNVTYATIHNGWLSEYETQAGDASRMTASFDMFESSAYKGSSRKSWLGQDGSNWN